MSERTKEERAKFRRMAEHLRGTLVDCATMEPLGTDSLVDVAERLNEMGCLTVQAAPEISEAMVERAAQVLANERFKRHYGYYPKGYPAEIVLEDRDVADRTLRAAEARKEGE